MPTVDAILAPGVVAHQDDEHQRRHQPGYIYQSIQLVARQKSEKTSHTFLF
jgi:membrane-bound lytic murein transglycosylase MltF